MKRKGFTLVELLAVIVILAIILLIAVPNILNVINKSEKGVFESSIKMAFKAAEYERLINPNNLGGDLDNLETFDSKKLIGTWKYEDDKIKLCDVSNGKFTVFGCVSENEKLDIAFDDSPRILLNVSDLEISQRSKVVLKEDDFSLFNEGGNKYSVLVDNEVVSLPYTVDYLKYRKNNISVVYSLENGNSVTRNINIIVDIVNADNSGANYPDLADNMVPVKWNGTSWIKADVFNEEGVNKWYDYNEKMWANAVTVTSSSRENYINSPIGTAININDIIQMYVWLPRYKYTMLSGYHTSYQGEFGIVFENEKEITGVDDLTTPCINDVYCTHPAFTSFKTRGLWVAKFEAGNNSDIIKIKPNEISLKNITAGNMFELSLNLNKEGNFYGFNTNDDIIDPHMMKNTEWGAVMYLTNSVYGKNSEIWINNYNGYKTGCAGDSVGASPSDVCKTYESETGVNASTTGTIYGIYDMSGGAWEYLAANYGEHYYADYPEYSKIIVDNLNSKYVDNVFGGNTLENTKGMAMYETSSSANNNSSWNTDYSEYVTEINPVVIRGGYHSYKNLAGGYSYQTQSGYPYIGFGFRPVIAVY